MLPVVAARFAFLLLLGRSGELEAGERPKHSQHKTMTATTSAEDQTPDKDGGYESFVQFLHDDKVKAENKVGSFQADEEKGLGDVVAGETAPKSNGVDLSESKRIARGSMMGISRRASTTEERRNPFAAREGNALIWTGVNMTLVSDLPPG